MNINYTSLNEPVSRADIQGYKEAYSQPEVSSTKKAVSIIASIIAAGLLLTVPIVTRDISIFVIMLIIGTPFVLIYYRDIYNRKKKLARVFKFANENQLRLVVDSTDVTYPGTVFSIGHSKKIDEALIFPDGKEIGTYQYTTGSGKYARTQYWGYMRVRLVRHLPNMLLDSKKNNFMKGLFSNLPQSYEKNQTIKLEGNFNDYFTLYAPTGYERDAFYVFTPDVMVALIDHGVDFDIEAVDNSLMFYSHTPINLGSEREITKVLSVLDRVSSELIDQGGYYADERVGNRASDTIASHGQRLKVKFSWVVLIIVVLCFAVVIFG